MMDVEHLYERPETNRGAVYAVYEVTERGDQLRGLFPPSDDGCSDAIAWGVHEFDNFHAASAGEMNEVGDAYLKKEHGITMYGGE